MWRETPEGGEGRAYKRKDSSYAERESDNQQGKDSDQQFLGEKFGECSAGGGGQGGKWGDRS